MKKYLLILFVMLQICTGPVWAESLTVLQEPLRPNGLVVGSAYIYVLEEPTIYVYSRKDYRLVRKFGKQGEGPGEFKTSHFGIMPMFIFPDHHKLVVNSSSKVSFFTLDGQYKKEVKVPPMLVFYPFSDGYICTGSSKNKKGDTVLNLRLCDAEFKPGKELYQSDMIVGMSAALNFPLSSFAFQSYREKAYIVSGKEGFVIHVFDKKGNLLKRIEKKYKPLKVSPEYIKKTENYYKNSSKMKQFWSFLKERLVFKEYYPAILDMKVRDQRIYVLTNLRRADNTECIIMDLEGREQKRLFVPLPENYGDINYLYDIRDGYFFRLVDNEEEESWELHKFSLGSD